MKRNYKKKNRKNMCCFANFSANLFVAPHLENSSQEHGVKGVTAYCDRIPCFEPRQRKNYQHLQNFSNFDIIL